MTNVPGQTDCHYYCDVYQGQGEGGDWRGQVASAALSQDWLVITMVITPHYPRLIDGGWENVYLAQVCPRVPLPSSGLQSTLLTVGNFTLGPQPAPAASHHTTPAQPFVIWDQQLSSGLQIGILLLQSTELYWEDSVDIP